ncbi:HAD family hydrolase [Bifidobacterium sp. 82T24]|uniref:HAD family hydrolase n=1 Tax=Bifidobacterium pluvialisilvae TaxID=2834436 RepID=UPI001C5A54E3|nr:HAD family hydrolase [Bifidobacterium pluvialisilvae]MBW3088186.1 HAD family hydrolase [Bifidobacterium pluvialisilvae]
MTDERFRMIVADLDGTMLHDADTFEGRFMTQYTIDTVKRMHDDFGVKFAIATARPVSTAMEFVRRLPVDACVYLNGALLDFSPSKSDERLLTSGVLPSDGHLMKVGFSSQRACEVCRFILDELPGIRIGIVMNDVRYTNFDVRAMWKTQSFQYTDFTDVPEGVADKIIILPKPEQWSRLREIIPPDFEVSISEGVMWMLMNPLANKDHALNLLCEKLNIPLQATASFGDDLIDISMLERSGRGVAVANANPHVLDIADEICPANNEDGVAQWIEHHYGM